jgi:truncated hemoglobin YjbI
MLGLTLVPLACFGDAHAEAHELIAAPLKGIASRAAHMGVAQGRRGAWLGTLERACADAAAGVRDSWLGDQRRRSGDDGAAAKLEQLLVGAVVPLRHRPRRSQLSHVGAVSSSATDGADGGACNVAAIAIAPPAEAEAGGEDRSGPESAARAAAGATASAEDAGGWGNTSEKAEGGHSAEGGDADNSAKPSDEWLDDVAAGIGLSVEVLSTWFESLQAACDTNEVPARLRNALLARLRCRLELPL